MSYSSYFSPAFGAVTTTSNHLPQLSSGSSRKRRLISSFEDVGPSIDSSVKAIRQPASVKGRTSGLHVPNRLSSPSDELARDEEPESFVLDTDTARNKARKLRVGLRHQHLNSIIAVLHRSILAQDFMRAERAWASLLRAEINGHSFDLRIGSRWGIGAEVLLRSNDWNWKGGQQSGRPPRSRLDIRSSAKVKSYLERLILQHPYRKAAPHAIGPTDFYLALFSLWIRSIADCPTMEDDRSGLTQGRESSIVLANELSQRLDNLLSSPIFSDGACFWRLKDMINLWVADLSQNERSSPKARGDCVQ